MPADLASLRVSNDGTEAIQTADQIGKSLTAMGAAGDQAAKKVADSTKPMTQAMQQATAQAAAEAGAIDKLSASIGGRGQLIGTRFTCWRDVFRIIIHPNAS
jgi:hypothetical protein